MTIGRDELFKGDPFFKTTNEDNNNWNTRMRAGVVRTIIGRCFANAEAIAEKAPPISRELVVQCCEAYFAHGSKESMNRRAMISLTWTAGGRAEEAVVASWNMYAVCPVSKLGVFQWCQPKTSKPNPVWKINK